MRHLKSSRDNAAFQSISYKFPIGETKICATIRKDETGRVFYTHIKILSAKSITSPQKWNLDYYGQKIRPGFYNVTETGTPCNFKVTIHKNYLGNLIMSDRGLGIPLKDRRVELILKRIL